MKTAIILVGLAASAVSANAQTTFTQTNTFGPTVVNFDETLIFNLINIAPSDILSVEWVYSLSVDGGQLIVDNDSDESASITASFGAELDVSSSSQTLLDSGFQPIFNDVVSSTNASFVLAANQGDGLLDYDPTGPDGTTIVGQNVTSSGSGLVNSAFFSQYAGNGTFALELDAGSLTDVSGGGGIEFASTPANASGFITLNVTAVPEPSSALLGMTGLLGFVLRRRR